MLKRLESVAGRLERLEPTMAAGTAPAACPTWGSSLSDVSNLPAPPSPLLCVSLAANVLLIILLLRGVCASRRSRQSVRDKLQPTPSREPMAPASDGMAQILSPLTAASAAAARSSHEQLSALQSATERFLGSPSPQLQAELVQAAAACDVCWLPAVVDHAYFFDGDSPSFAPPSPTQHSVEEGAKQDMRDNLPEVAAAVADFKPPDWSDEQVSEAVSEASLFG